MTGKKGGITYLLVGIAVAMLWGSAAALSDEEDFPNEQDSPAKALT